MLPIKPWPWQDAQVDFGLVSSWLPLPSTAGRVATLAWNTLTMKLGLAPWLSIAVAVAGAAADCPDFTTYSQVRAPKDVSPGPPQG